MPSSKEPVTPPPNGDISILDRFSRVDLGPDNPVSNGRDSAPTSWGGEITSLPSGTTPRDTHLEDPHTLADPSASRIDPFDRLAWGSAEGSSGILTGTMDPSEAEKIQRDEEHIPNDGDTMNIDDSRDVDDQTEVSESVYVGGVCLGHIPRSLIPRYLMPRTRNGNRQKGPHQWSGIQKSKRSPDSEMRRSTQASTSVRVGGLGSERVGLVRGSTIQHGPVEKICGVTEGTIDELRMGVDNLSVDP